jgi:acetyl esterase/lipase
MQAALQYARYNAENLGFAPDKLGVIGFSAGGHLASMASCVFTEQPLRPNFNILFYPVTDMENRGMTRPNLLGENPSREDLEYYSSHLRVTENTPPTLLFLCDDDPRVSPRHSIMYYEALKAKNVPASMHIYSPPAGTPGGSKDQTLMEGSSASAISCGPCSSTGR